MIIFLKNNELKKKGKKQRSKGRVESEGEENGAIALLLYRGPGCTGPSKWAWAETGPAQNIYLRGNLHMQAK